MLFSIVLSFEFFHQLETPGCYLIMNHFCSTFGEVELALIPNDVGRGVLPMLIDGRKMTTLAQFKESRPPM